MKTIWMISVLVTSAAVQAKEHVPTEAEIKELRRQGHFHSAKVLAEERARMLEAKKGVATLPEPKAEAKGAEVKPEAKGAEPKPEAKAPELRAEAKASEPKPEAKGAEPKAEAKASEPKAEAKGAEVKAEAKGAELKAEAKAPELKAEAKAPQPKAEAKAFEPKPEAKAPEPKAEAKTPEPKAEAKGEAKTAANLERIHVTPVAEPKKIVPQGPMLSSPDLGSPSEKNVAVKVASAGTGDAPPNSEAVFEMIQKQMRRNLLSIDRCKNAVGTLEPELTGAILMAISVAQHKVAKAKVVSDSMNHALLERCLLRAADSWTFGPASADFRWEVKVGR